MVVNSGVSSIFTQLDSSDPRIGKTTAGSSNLAAHGDHIHPLLIPIGVYIDSGKPCLESTSTLCYIWVPSGNYLAWDDVNELFVYG